MAYYKKTEPDVFKPLKTGHNRNTSSYITVSDFNRIRQTIIPSTTEETDKKNREAHLKGLSQTRIMNWPDSIQLAKQMKLIEKKKNYYEKEMDKRKIEEEERRYNEAQKVIVLEKANKILFENQDQVKLFRGKMLLSDVLKV